VSRAEKESRLAQRGQAVWLYGLPGAGKTTLASALEARLASMGYATALLDGDRIRGSLNRDLGFSDADRTENLRRSAEVARLLVEAGLVAVCAFITPRASQRRMVRSILGEDDLVEVFLSAGLAQCSGRDPKGLYARARAGGLAAFTGIGSEFEPPGASEHPLAIDSGGADVEACLARLLERVVPRLGLRR
jgi:adenylylsulfate kinase